MRKLPRKNVKMFQDYLPYAGLLNDGVAITKEGILLSTAKFTVRDLGFASEYEIANTFQSLNNAFRMMTDGGWYVYIDAFRDNTEIEFHQFNIRAPKTSRDFDSYHNQSLGKFMRSDYYITLARNPYKRSKISDFLFGRETGEESLSQYVHEFKQNTQDIFAMIGNSFDSLHRLDEHETFSFYYRSIKNKDVPLRAPECQFYLDYFLTDDVLVPDTITKVGDSYIFAISLKDFPEQTRPDMVTALMTCSLTFRFNVRFQFYSLDEARTAIKSFRKSHYQKRKGVGSLLSEAVLKEDTTLEDTEALAATEDASIALSSIGTSYFGKMTTTIIITDEDYQRGQKKVHEIKKIVNHAQYIAKEETINNPLAYLGSLHGSTYNGRSPMMSTSNLAHMFPLTSPWSGSVCDEHLHNITGCAQPHMTVRAGNTVFYLNLNIGDVGHTLIVGPTGSGKSILLNTLALQYFRYPGARVIFFDKDRSSMNPCYNIGGQFFDLGSENPGFLLNPFCNIRDKNYRIWLSGFLCQHFKNKKIAISPGDEIEVLGALDSMEEMELSSLNFETLKRTIQNEEMRAALTQFTTGEYSQLFDSINDNISDSHWITFEMNELMGMDSDIVNFVLGYLFQKLSMHFQGKPTLLVIDEAWLFLDNAYFSIMLKDWLKTLRKKNVYVILATQEMADSRNSDIFPTIVNACMTKILLPNNQAKQSENYELYRDIGVADEDVQALVDATPKRDYFYFSPKGKQMFNLALDEKQLKILKEKI